MELSVKLFYEPTDKIRHFCTILFYMASNRKAAIGFIFITLMIDITGLGLIIPVLPKIIQQLTTGNISDASRIGGWLTFTYAIMQFIFAPVLGGLSDKFGRRPVLLIALFGFAMDYLFLSFAPTIGWLFFGKSGCRCYRCKYNNSYCLYCRYKHPTEQGTEFWNDRGRFWAGVYHRALLSADYWVVLARVFLSWLRQD